MKESFCPKCGKKGEGFGKRNLCRECWKEENEIVEIPDTVKVEVCPHCGFMKHKNRWIEVDNDSEIISKTLNKYIKDYDAEAEFEREEDLIEVDLILRKDLEGEKVSQKAKVDIKEEKQQCPECSRRVSGYFKTIMQLRGENLEQALRDIEKRSESLQDRRNYVSKVETVSDGYDIYLSSKEITQKILKVLKDNYSLETKRSYKLIGEKEGQRVYRNYVSVRIEG